MLRRRLYLQIYVTIIASLVIVVVLSGLLWSVFGRDQRSRPSRGSSKEPRHALLAESLGKPSL